MRKQLNWLIVIPFKFARINFNNKINELKEMLQD